VKELEIVRAFEILSESKIRRAGYSDEDASEYNVSARGQARAGLEVFLAEGAPAASPRRTSGAIGAAPSEGLRLPLAHPAPAAAWSRL